MLGNYKKSLLALSVLAVLNGTAFAQEDAKTESKKELEAEPAVAEIEVITVQGTRGSLKRSMNAKRFADQVMDGVSAEDIGKLPDNNIAEALSRVVGVSMERSDGEGEYVSIRGMDPSLSKVTVNGQSMASGNSGANPNDASSRSVNLNNIASEMVSAIEIFKSPTANMVEGAIGGTVNLKTRKPIQVGNKASIALKGEYNENSEEYGKGIDGFFNLVNDDETIGFATTISYFDRTTQRNSFESRGWSLQKKAPYVNEYNADGSLKKAGVSDTPVYRIEDIRASFRTDERTRINVNSKLQWTPTEDIDINLDLLYSQQDRDYISSNWDVDFRDNDKLTVLPESIVIEGGNVVRQIVNANRDNATSKFNFEQTGFHRTYDDESLTGTLSINYNINEQWSVLTTLGSSKAEQDQYSVNPLFAGKVDGLGYELANYSWMPNIIYPTDSENLNAMEPQNLILDNLNFKNFITDDTHTNQQIDVTYEMENDYLRSIEFGVRHAKSEKEFESNKVDNKLLKATIKELNNGEQITLDDYSNFTQVDSMLDNAPVDAWFVPDFDLISEQFEDLHPYDEILWENYAVEEETIAGYVQANINTELFGIPVRGNAGVRYVQTDIESGAYKNSPTQGIAWEWQTIEHDYDDWLPSLNLAFIASDEFIVRTAASRVMSRPNHKQLSSSFRESGSAPDLRYTLGNPFLSPYRANQYDLSLEWYFNAEGLLSAGLFYKDIDDFIIEVVEDRVVPGFNNNWPIEVQQPVNGEAAEVQGLELSFQQAFTALPSPFDGFGTALNYTYNDSETELENALTGEAMSLPGLSKETYNATIYYEKYGFNVRLAWNKRSNYFKAYSWSGEALYIDDYEQLDVNAGYNISKNMSVSFNARNITDEISKEYVGNRSRAYAARDNGRSYSLTFRYKFN